jgi:hypothetical protein
LGQVAPRASWVTQNCSPKLRDADRLASIHSNPPGIDTDKPAAVLNQFGKGEVLHVAGDIVKFTVPRLETFRMLALDFA